MQTILEDGGEMGKLIDEVAEYVGATWHERGRHATASDVEDAARAVLGEMFEEVNNPTLWGPAFLILRPKIEQPTEETLEDNLAKFRRILGEFADECSILAGRNA
jgi:hypothetical protein